MVTKFVPLPANSGGKQRSLALLTRLAESRPTVLCAFDDGAADLDGLADLASRYGQSAWTPSPPDCFAGRCAPAAARRGAFGTRLVCREVLAATAEPP